MTGNGYEYNLLLSRSVFSAIMIRPCLSYGAVRY